MTQRNPIIEAATVAPKYPLPQQQQSRHIDLSYITQAQQAEPPLFKEHRSYGDQMCNAKSDYEQLMVLHDFDAQWHSEHPEAFPDNCPPEEAQNIIFKSAVWVGQSRAILNDSRLVEAIRKGLSRIKALYLTTLPRIDPKTVAPGVATSPERIAAYQEGQLSHAQGFVLADNPYIQLGYGSAHYVREGWDMGWKRADKENAEVVAKDDYDPFTGGIKPTEHIPGVLGREAMYAAQQEAKAPGGTCDKCGHEIKERQLLSGSYVGCMC